jgi:replicative DNA helicase
MMIEQNLLSAILSSDYAKTFLPKLNPDWFTGWHKGLVRTMQDMYQHNEPIALHTVYTYHKDRAKDIGFLINAYVTDKTINNDILSLEIQYKHKQLLNQLGQIGTDWDLSKIQNFLEQINHDSRITLSNEVQSISQVMGKKIDEIEERIKSGNKMKGLQTGWRTLDKYLGGWNKGNLVVVGGRPGMGKSALGLNICRDGMQFNKYLFVSVEMSADELAERMLADMTNIENSKIRNANVNEIDLRRMVESLNDADFDIIDTKDNNIYNIISLIKIHRAKFGLDVVVIDYLQKLNAGGKDARSNVSNASTALKNLARELGITVIALAQLNRDGKNARPELTELKESGQIEQDADCVLFPFRPSYYEDIKPEIEDAVVIIAKNRHGRLCDIPCTFEGKFTRYREAL